MQKGASHMLGGHGGTRFSFVQKAQMPAVFLLSYSCFCGLLSFVQTPGLLSSGINPDRICS